MNLSWDLGRKVVPVVHKTSAPSGTDTAYNVPTLWLDDTANVAYLLVDITSGTATWRQLQTNVSNMTTATDPAANAATTAAIVAAYSGTIITTTAAGNSQTLASPSVTTAGRTFMVINNDTSTHSIPVVANSVTFTITPGEAQMFIWDGTAWGPIDMGITEIPVPITQGGTGAITAQAAINALSAVSGATNEYVLTKDTATGNAIFKANVGGIPVAAAAGTVDAITADYTPDVTLADQKMVAVVAAGANTSTTPTFAPDGLTAHTIVKNGGAALAAGDIAGAGHVIILEYNLAGTRWELINPKVNIDLTAPGPIGGTTPALGQFSPMEAKGPAIINTGFAGTVTAAASTTVTFSSAADAILAGYSATNPILGTTLISNALTRYIMSWTNATTCVVDSSVTWAGTAITSVQLPIATFVNSAGIKTGFITAAGQLTLYRVTGSHGVKITGTEDYANYYIDINEVLTSNIARFSTLAEFSNSKVMLITGASGNVIVGGTHTAGSNALKVIAVAVGTAPTTSPASVAQMWVGDIGGVADKAGWLMRDEEGNVTEIGLSSVTVGTGTGLTVNQKGRIAQQVYKVTVTYAAYSDTDLTKGIVIATLPAKTRLVATYTDTTVPYAGTSITAVTLEVGVTAEGAAEIIAPHDVLAGAVTKGLADADMGTAMTRAAQIQGAYLPSFTGTTAVYATLDATTGAATTLANLTAGSTTFYLITERL